MKTNPSIVCIGELLIDFFCTDVDTDLMEGRNFLKQAGGAPANVCATIEKLGGHALFCGKVGNDAFGHFLKNKLDKLKVDTTMLLLDDEHSTTVAFVSLKANGERDFVFQRGADAFLTEEELDQEKLKNNRIAHFGSATALLSDPFQSTYLRTMKSAKKAGQFISFDPNFRKDLWKDNVANFVDLVKKGLAIADFVKVSEDELILISGVTDLSKGMAYLHQLGAGVVAVTLGKEGTLLSNGQRQANVPSIQVQSIDSTGAGDAFVGATLFQLAKEEEPHRILNDFDALEKMISFSNKVGAMVCTKIGAISAIPTLDELSELEKSSDLSVN